MPIVICPVDGVHFSRHAAYIRKLAHPPTCSRECAKRYCARPEVIAARLWPQVDKTQCLGTICGCQRDLGCCWVWTGYRMPNTYGQISINNRAYLVHRVVYALDHEIPLQELPDELYICHRCDVPYCVRHLFQGTQQDNMQDSIAKGRFVYRPDGWSVGSNHPRARLTEADVRTIRALEHVESTSALAKRFHCQPEQIRRIQRRLSWSSLP